MTESTQPETSEQSSEGIDPQIAETASTAASSEETSAPEESELAQAKAEIATLRKEVAAANDKYLRSLADFENFKKRSLKERSELIKYQGEPVIVDLLRVIDEFELAIQFQGSEFQNSDPEKFKEGVGLIHKNLLAILNKWDIRAESSVGKTFDPAIHQAISKVVSPDVAPGTIVAELKKVFFYKDKLIRIGDVIVAVEDTPA